MYRWFILRGDFDGAQAETLLRGYLSDHGDDFDFMQVISTCTHPRWCSPMPAQELGLVLVQKGQREDAIKLYQKVSGPTWDRTLIGSHPGRH